MKVASLAGYLSLALLALILVACGSSQATVESEDSTTPAAASSNDEESSDVESVPAASAANCEPTQADMLGPYYVAGAPERTSVDTGYVRSEEHTSELQSRQYLVCRLLLEKKKTQTII